jgi:archaellin
MFSAHARRPLSVAVAVFLVAAIAAAVLIRLSAQSDRREVRAGEGATFYFTLG